MSLNNKKIEGIKKWLCLAIILLPNLMISLNTYMLQVALPMIQKEIIASFSEAQMILSGYALGLSATLIVCGKLGDLFGQKRLLKWGVIGFMLTAVLGSIAQSAWQLIFIRLLQGIFGACIQPQVLVLMRSNFKKEEHSLVFAIYGALTGIGFTFGLILGGLIMHLNLWNLSWRNIFLINIPFCFLILVGLGLVSESKNLKKDAIDYTGAIILMIGVTLIAYELFYFKIRQSASTSLLIILCGIGMIGYFIKHEKRMVKLKKPVLLDMIIFKQVGFTWGLLTILAVYINMFGYFFLITYYSQWRLNYDVLLTSLVFLPLGIGFILSSLWSAKLLRLLQKKLLYLGVTLMLFSVLALSFWSYYYGELLTPVGLLALSGYGIGLGMTTTPLVGLVLNCLPFKFSGIGGGLLNTIMYFANMLGVCLIGIIFNYGINLLSVSEKSNNMAIQKSFSYSLLVVCIFIMLTQMLVFLFFKKTENKL